MLELRKRILKVIPNAEEVVSYGMPAFKVSGSIVAGIKANQDYIGYYPFSGSVLKNFKKELEYLERLKEAPIHQVSGQGGNQSMHGNTEISMIEHILKHLWGNYNSGISNI